MSNNANPAAGAEIPENYAPLVDENKEIPYNTRQQVKKLVRQIQHKHNYGVSILAQQSIKVNELQEKLVELGFPKVELLQPDWSDPSLLEGYAELSNYKR